MQRVHFQVGVGVFNCQQILTKISFIVFNIEVNGKQWVDRLNTTPAVSWCDKSVTFSV